MKTLYCNSFEVSHSKEAFCLILKFEAPNGHTETVYVAISPAGAKTLLNVLGKEMSDYELQHGEVKPWELSSFKSNPSNAERYVA